MERGSVNKAHFVTQPNVVGCNNIQFNFTSQHNCNVVKYVNYVNFYVDIVASN